MKKHILAAVFCLTTGWSTGAVSSILPDIMGSSGDYIVRTTERNVGEKSRPMAIEAEQSCSVGNLILESQSQVDAYIENYSECTTLVGNVTIRNLTVTNLSFLSNLITIRGGSLKIYDCPNLTSLNGLHNLSSLWEGGVEIYNCPALTSLGGLQALRVVGGHLILKNLGISNLNGLEQLPYLSGELQIAQMPVMTSLAGLSSFTFANAITISGNPLLTTFDSFENLTSVGVFLNIDQNPSLTSLNAFQNLTTIGSTNPVDIHNLKIHDSPLLTSFNAFQKLTFVSNIFSLYNLGITNLSEFAQLVHIGGGLYIANNPSLTVISGFGSLPAIGGRLEIHENPSLVTISGFQKLTSIGDDLSLYKLGLTSLDGFGKLESISKGLSIERLPALTSLTGFTSLVSVGTFVNVVFNEVLNDCSVAVFCEKLANTPELVGFIGNATGCATNQEVENACAALPVTLVSFQVMPEGQSARLSWETTSEVNSDYFEIQHATDTRIWNVIGFIKSEGQSTIQKNYTFSHSPAVGGMQYYRLRMVDKDGTFEFSPIRNLLFNDREELLVYPNPAMDRFRLKSPSDLKQLDIYNLTGVRVLTVSAIPSYGIDLSHLSPGQYTVKATRKDGSFISGKVFIVK